MTRDDRATAQDRASMNSSKLVRTETLISLHTSYIEACTTRTLLRVHELRRSRQAGCVHATVVRRPRGYVSNPCLHFGSYHCCVAALLHGRPHTTHRNNSRRTTLPQENT